MKEKANKPCHDLFARLVVRNKEGQLFILRGDGKEMDSGEALKHVLDKFTNELTLVEEELNLVHEQIKEMETRLELCQKKQGTVNQDRNEVLSMLMRYVQGASEAPIQTISDANIQTKKPTTETSDKKKVNKKQEETPSLSSLLADEAMATTGWNPAQDSTTNSALSPDSSAESGTPEVASTATNLDEGSNQADELNNETVKSFNDAMRSLFNKK